jgi:hypothetical protein
MAGYSTTPLPKKLGIKEGMVFAALNPPVDYEILLGRLPDGTCERKSLRGKLDFIHFFTKSESELRKTFPKLKASLSKDGILWISWPKGSSKAATALNGNRVRDLGLQTGLVDVKICAVDETWSGLKFVYRLRDRNKS